MDFRKFSLVFLFCLAMFTNCRGVSVQMTSSASKVERGKSVTLNIRVENIDTTDHYPSIYVYMMNDLAPHGSNIVHFDQYSSRCSAFTNDRNVPDIINAYCGSGTKVRGSRLKQYRVVMTTAAMTRLTGFYCRIEYNNRYYDGNTVTVTITHKVDCCVLSVSEGGDLLTVVEGKRYDGFTCKVGGASPEPETKLKMYETDLRVTTRKSVTSFKTGRTLCSPLKYELYSTKTEVSFTYIPERSHHNKEIYCSARNSEMRTDEDVKSNRIRLVVHYGPVDEETSLKPDKTTHTLTEFGSLRVSCVADCRPGCTYTWSFLDHDFAAGENLSLSDVTQQQSGYYKCTARNPATGAKVEKFFRINVVNSAGRQYSGTHWGRRTKSSHDLTNPSDAADENGKLSFSAGVGVGVSCCVVVAGVVAVVICIIRKRKESAKGKSSTSKDHIYENRSFHDRGGGNVNPEEQYEDLRQQ